MSKELIEKFFDDALEQEGFWEQLMLNNGGKCNDIFVQIEINAALAHVAGRYTKLTHVRETLEDHWFRDILYDYKRRFKEISFDDLPNPFENKNAWKWAVGEWQWGENLDLDSDDEWEELRRTLDDSFEEISDVVLECIEYGVIEGMKHSWGTRENRHFDNYISEEDEQNITEIMQSMSGVLSFIDCNELDAFLERKRNGDFEPCTS